MYIKKYIKFFFYSLFLIIICFSCQKYKTIFINDKKIRVEIVDSKEERQKGLMFRDKLDPDNGMLFIFENTRILSFWMKNTFIPLSIAFIDTNCSIVRITDMSPLSEDTFYSSVYPVKYALEVNRGWFKLNHIKVGDKVKGLE